MKAPNLRIPFKSESELVTKIIETKTRILAKKKSVAGIDKEFECHIGRADIVVYFLRRDWRKRSQYKSISPRWLYSLTLLPYRRQFASSHLADLAGVSEKTARKVLLQYCKGGYCRRTKSGGRWIKLVQPVPIINHLIAIEAKLKKWRDALSQAYRYLEYAHESWVTMDAETSSAFIPRVDRFQRLNIGLSSIDVHGKLTIHFSPRKSTPKSDLRFWEANGILARRLRGS